MILAKPIKATLGILVLFAFLVVLVVLHHNLLTEPFPGHNDFLVPWEASRAFWLDRQNPYSEETTLSIQRKILGRPALPEEFPAPFAYPMYTVVLLMPLVVLPYTWASAIWMVILEFLLVIALLIITDLLRWRPSPLMLGLLVIFTFGFYFAARGLLLGQIGLLIYVLEIASLWSLARGYDRAAGFLLALSTIKPQMGFLIIPGLLIWALFNRRWTFVRIFAISIISLLAISFVLLPDWLNGWFFQLTYYPSYTEIGSPISIITSYYLALGQMAEILISGLIVLFLIVQWVFMLRGQPNRWLWICTLTLAVTHLVAPRTATPHFVIFFLPTIFYIATLVQSGTHRGILWSVLLILMLTVLPWLQFIITLRLEDKFEHPSMYVLVPAINVLVLWFTRHWWWEVAVLKAKST